MNARRKVSVWKRELEELADDTVKEALVWAPKAKAPEASLRNVFTVLDTDPQFDGRLSFNEFTGTVDLDGEPVEDHLVIALTIWLDTVYDLKVSPERCFEALKLAARRSPYHPVRDYLTSLTWDGTRRIEAWLTTYFGAADTPLHRALGPRFLVSLVARVMSPGCQVDTVLVLTGAQGAGKSTGLRALAGDAWFSDTTLPIGQKDAYIALQGVWLYELAELDSFRGRDATAIKAFISSRLDNFRAPFERANSKHLRQVVFSGTTNEEDFLVDATGSRRFWPVPVGKVDRTAIARDRDQLWAEAVAWWQAGEPWHLTDDEGAQLQEASRHFQAEDLWDAPIGEYCRMRAAFTLAQLFREEFEKDPGDVSRADQMRATAILRRMGWRKERRTVDRVQAVWWLAPKVAPR